MEYGIPRIKRFVLKTCRDQYGSLEYSHYVLHIAQSIQNLNENHTSPVRVTKWEEKGWS